MGYLSWNVIYIPVAQHQALVINQSTNFHYGNGCIIYAKHRSAYDLYAIHIQYGGNLWQNSMRSLENISIPL